MPDLDLLVLGDIGLEQLAERDPAPILGGAAGRLAAHAAALGASVALVGKLGDDRAASLVRGWLRALGIDLQWLRSTGLARTSVWVAPDRDPTGRVYRGADASLRLDELPAPGATRTGITLVSGYSLAVEPVRAAALGALRTAAARRGTAALQVEAGRLFGSNPRMARRLLEPAIAAAGAIALTASDARLLLGASVNLREAARGLTHLGPAIVYLADEEGGVLLQEGERLHLCPGAGRPAVDRYAGPAAFWAARAAGMAPRRAALQAVRYAHAVRHSGAPRRRRRPSAAGER